MSVKNRVLAYLNERKPKQLCDVCIERALDCDFKTVNPINRRFAELKTIKRGNGICQDCGKSKLVNCKTYQSE